MTRFFHARLGLLAAFALSAGAGCSSADGTDLSPAQLQTVIERERPGLQTCYQAALRDKPYKQEIRMQAALHIRPAGDVYKVEVEEGGLGNMATCIEKAIMRWKFPVASEETHAALPLIFRPEIVNTPQ